MKNDETIKQIGEDIIDRYRDEVFELNDFMADYPEVSGKEYEAVKKIVTLLTQKGLQVEYPFAGLENSFKATINKNKEKKAAILVEYDALPDIGHGCGHCASGSISILAGLILYELKDRIDAQIDIIGTPDEEFMGGKIILAEKGVFDQYDFAIMIHMNNNKNYVYTGFLALDGLEFQFTGKPSHAAASPWEGKNALNAVQLMFHAIDMMRQHVKPDIRIHGYIKEGGKASNIIPDFASAEVLTRGIERKYLDEITEWVKDCARAAALATRTSLEIRTICPPFKDLAPNKTAENLLREIYNDLGLEITDLENQPYASSDIGEIDYICPSFHPFISIGEPFELHTKEFASAMKSKKTHDAILKGGEIIARFVISVFDNTQLLDNIKEEHKRYRY